MTESSDPGPGTSSPAGHGRSLPRALVRTTVAALLPLPVLVAVGWFWGRPHRDQVVGAAVDPDTLRAVVVGIALGWVLWVTLIWVTYARSRPRGVGTGRRVTGVVVVVVLCALVATPLSVGARYALVQRDLVTSVFADAPRSVTTPPPATAAAPFGDRKRVNVLLLGGDGKVGRPGVRTDSVILASVEVATGRTVLFSLPRNLQRVPFPVGSPLHRLYPGGFTGDDDQAEYFLNAVYRNVPALHPGVLGRTDNEGADAVKLAVSGALGIRVDYYVLVNLGGFRQIVDAIGGITVNVDRPIPIGGNTDAGIPPDGYVQPGPDRRLDGFRALWFTRGRYGLDDYQRMERQRCALKAIVDEADPLTLLRRYTRLARTGARILRTDIPQPLLGDLVRLSLTMKEQRLRSVVFQPSPTFDPNDPDYDVMRTTVRRALGTARPTGKTPRARPARPRATDGSVGADADADQDTRDACAYHPAVDTS